MCGLFGMMGPGILQRDLDAIKELGIFSQIRGRHSSGVYQVRSAITRNNYLQTSNEKLVKIAENFSTFLDMIEDDKTLLNSTYVDVIMGHVRYATKGVLSKANAHPFMLSNIVGAHNGTLKDAKYNSVGFSMTDSEQMFEDMNDHGIEPVIESLDRDSAFAITIYDRTDHNMYFIRNELRPLSFAFLTDRAVVYWSSELKMLEYILDRRGMEYKSFNLKPNVLVKMSAKDISVQAIKEDPLKVMKRVAKIDRPLPSIYDKVQNSQSHTVVVQQPVKEEVPAKDNTSSNLPAVVDNLKSGTSVPSVGKHSKKNNNVLSFPPRGSQETIKDANRKFSAKNFYAQCDCGCVTMNLFEASKAARGKNPEVRYDTESDKYYCLVCDPEQNKKETVN